MSDLSNIARTREKIAKLVERGDLFGVRGLQSIEREVISHLLARSSDGCNEASEILLTMCQTKLEGISEWVKEQPSSNVRRTRAKKTA
jgi:hypothetical protein